MQDKRAENFVSVALNQAPHEHEGWSETGQWCFYRRGRFLIAIWCVWKRARTKLMTVKLPDIRTLAEKHPGFFGRGMFVGEFKGINFQVASYAVPESILNHYRHSAPGYYNVIVPADARQTKDGLAYDS